jgi:TonB-dependent siderophore receptor
LARQRSLARRAFSATTITTGFFPSARETRLRASDHAARATSPFSRNKNRKIMHRSEQGTRQSLMACAIRLALPLLASAALPAGPAAAQAPANTARDYDIPAGPLSSSLARFAGETDVPLSANATLTAGKQAPALRGRFTVREALDRLLAGSELEASIQAGTVVIRRAPRPAAVPVAETALGEVKVKAAREAGFGDTLPEQPGFRAEYQSSSTKTPLEIRETPQAISVVTRDSMDERQTRDANSALELSSGVVSGRSGHGGPFAGRGLNSGENFNMRGQELNPDRDVRVDGYAVPSSAFDLAAYERVEAIKGPSSMLYGQGSIGGFVNMVRKKPQAEPMANVAVQAGSWNTYRTEMDVAGAISDDKHVTGRLTAVYDDSGSFTDGVKTRIGLLAPSLEARIGERTRALFQLLYQDDAYVPSQGVPLVIEGSRARAPNIPRSMFVGIPSQQESSSKNTLASVRLDHELSDRWLGSLYLQTGKQTTRRFFDSYGYSWYGLAGGMVSLAADRADIQNNNWAGELRLDGKFNAFGRDHRLLAGLERNQRKNRTTFGYEYLGSTNIYQGNFATFGTVPGGAASMAFDVDRGSRSTNDAFYVQTILTLAQRTKLLVGTRMDWANQTQQDFMAITESRKKEKEQTWRVGLTQDLAPNITAYASYAESFNPVDALSSSGNILDPETGKGFELGVKGEWFGKRVGASAAVFRQDLDNRPVPDPTDPANFSISSGLQRAKGMELEVSGNHRGFRVGAAATWIDAKHIDPLDPDFGLKPYDSVDRVFGVYAGYEIQGGDWRGFGFGATLSSVGKRSLSWAGNGAFTGSGTDELYVDGYERLDFNFYYRAIKGLDLSLQIRNVTDEFYIERVRDATGSNYFGSPRAVLLRVAYKFR